MKLKQSQLQKIIKEELKKILSEGDIVKGPWDIPPSSVAGIQRGEGEYDPEGEDDPEEFRYEHVLDELIDAARDAIMPLAVEKLKDAGAFAPTAGGERVEGGMRGGLTYNDIELEIEEPLLDALKPLAKIIQTKTENAAGTDEDDDW